MILLQRSRFVLIIFFFLLALLIASFNTATVSAQGIIIDPPWLHPQPTPVPLPLQPSISIEQHSVDAQIDGPVAHVQVTQRFRNEQAVAVEGVYVFPLPQDAVVSDFQLTVDGRTLEGELLGREEARRIYEEIVRNQRDPALLEYLGRELFQTSVFPIPAGATRTVSFSYTQVVPQQNGLFKFSYPLRTAPFDSAPVANLSLAVELRNQPGLRTIYSPQFALDIERADDSSASIRYRANAAQPDQDFELYFGVDEAAVGLSVLSYKPAGEDGFFLLLAAPSVDVAPEEIVERDLILVVDISGSMQGEKIEQARNAANGVLEQLHAGDRFNLIAFSTGVRLWQSELQPASAENRQAARAWINGLTAAGSTDINRSLLEGLGQLAGDAQRPAYMLFLTDGLPTQGQTEPQRIIQNALNNAPERVVRLFTFGVGFDVNTDLLDRLSRELGGRSTYVKPGEAIDEKVGDFYAGISIPVLTGLTLDWQSNNGIDELYPYPLPDLFAGDQLILLGRYQRGGPFTLTLNGTANERELSFHYSGRSLVTSGGEPFVARLWATRKIGALLEQIRQHGPLTQLVDEVVELSLAYGIVTPYTSYLVVEPEVQREQRAAEQVAPLMERARVGALSSLRESAAAPASGADAVAASETRNALVYAANVRQNAQVRYIAGKTFIQEALVEGAEGRTVVRWVDTAYNEEHETETVIFGSERYFVLARQTQLAPWLALSTELVVVVEEGKALRITQGE